MELVSEWKIYGVLPSLIRKVRSLLFWGKYKTFALRITEVAKL
jgi:hypothetical protein